MATKTITRQRLRTVARRTAKLEKARQEWRDSIREAVAAGATYRETGEAAGRSHVQVLRIVRGTETERAD